MYDLIIRNGTVVTSSSAQKADIGVQNGVIEEVSTTIRIDAKKEIDATGLHIFPGAVDVHVHFSEPGRAEWEGFRTGSRMLASGGITTFADMPLNGIPSTIDKAALLQKAAIGEEKSLVDFALWGGLVPGNLGELEGLAGAGAMAFKAFMSPTGNAEFEAVGDLDLLEGMKRIAELGKVIALHAESGPVTTFLAEQKRRAGRVGADDYLATRPISTEVEAVERAIYYATLTGCPLHFVHISSAEAVSVIQNARAEGVNVTLETCPHYLLLSHDTLKEKGAVAKCAPPLREKPDQAKLRKVMKMGKIDFLTSDHSPCTPDLKEMKNGSFLDAWGGISGGGQTLLAAIRFVKEEDIPLTTVAKWTAEKPAERFGLAQRKGRIAPGMDADFAIVSMEQPHVVTPDNFYAKHPISVYMDETFPASVQSVYVRGREVFTSGTGPAEGASGKWQVDVVGPPVL
ncbi:allantoinase AllB [Domibacillus iocasae]|uniref:Allantoinase n=1 Tax=Domibacillus iocasae TaxID=1714016 RepID=A0A1E7DSL6_9BACI|nr:allantoinase AllB [Domibacillus iocasae]OES46077.1 allantoinase [Domibacillus iocasae]